MKLSNYLMQELDALEPSENLREALDAYGEATRVNMTMEENATKALLVVELAEKMAPKEASGISKWYGDAAKKKTQFAPQFYIDFNKRLTDAWMRARANPHQPVLWMDGIASAIAVLEQTKDFSDARAEELKASGKDIKRKPAKKVGASTEAAVAEEKK